MRSAKVERGGFRFVFKYVLRTRALVRSTRASTEKKERKNVTPAVRRRRSVINHEYRSRALCAGSRGRRAHVVTRLRARRSSETSVTAYAYSVSCENTMSSNYTTDTWRKEEAARCAFASLGYLHRICVHPCSRAVRSRSRREPRAQMQRAGRNVFNGEKQSRVETRERELDVASCALAFVHPVVI